MPIYVDIFWLILSKHIRFLQGWCKFGSVIGEVGALISGTAKKVRQQRLITHPFNHLFQYNTIAAFNSHHQPTSVTIITHHQPSSTIINHYLPLSTIVTVSWRTHQTFRCPSSLSERAYAEPRAWRPCPSQELGERLWRNPWSTASVLAHLLVLS